MSKCYRRLPRGGSASRTLALSRARRQRPRSRLQAEDDRGPGAGAHGAPAFVTFWTLPSRRRRRSAHIDLHRLRRPVDRTPPDEAAVDRACAMRTREAAVDASRARWRVSAADASSMGVDVVSKAARRSMHVASHGMDVFSTCYALAEKSARGAGQGSRRGRGGRGGPGGRGGGGRRRPRRRRRCRRRRRPRRPRTMRPRRPRRPRSIQEAEEAEEAEESEATKLRAEREAPSTERRRSSASRRVHVSTFVVYTNIYCALRGRATTPAWRSSARRPYAHSTGRTREQAMLFLHTADGGRHVRRLERRPTARRKTTQGDSLESFAEGGSKR